MPEQNQLTEYKKTVRSSILAAINNVEAYAAKSVLETLLEELNEGLSKPIMWLCPPSVAMIIPNHPGEDHPNEIEIAAWADLYKVIKRITPWEGPLDEESFIEEGTFYFRLSKK